MQYFRVATDRWGSVIMDIERWWRLLARVGNRAACYGDSAFAIARQDGHVDLWQFGPGSGTPKIVEILYVCPKEQRVWGLAMKPGTSMVCLLIENLKDHTFKVLVWKGKEEGVSDTLSVDKSIRIRRCSVYLVFTSEDEIILWAGREPHVLRKSIP